MLVLPFKRNDSESAPTFAIFGKLPNRADFVRINATHPTALEFDELIQRAFERVAGDEGWEAQYRKSRPVDFQFVSRDRRSVMVGVLQPSMDQHGRQYPLVAGAILPADAVEDCSFVLPIAYEVYFDGLREQVANAIDNSVEALNCRQWLEGQLRSPEMAASDLDLAQSVVERFLETHTVAYLEDLLVANEPAAHLDQALLNLAFYLAYLSRFDSSITNQVIVLPLTTERGKQALVASTWLRILTALWQSKHMPINGLGSYVLLNRNEDRPRLAVCFGRMQEKMSTAMLGGDVEDAVVLDISREQEAWKSRPQYAESAYALGRLLADPQLPMKTLLDFLAVLGRKIENQN